MRNKVVIKKFDEKNYLNQVSEVLEKDFSFQKKLKNVKTVFIKPNLVSDVDSYIKNGSNTDIRIIESILYYLNKFPNLKVYLGESETGTKTKGRKLIYALENMGVIDLQKRYDFEIVNLTEDIQIETPIPNGKFLKKIKLGKTFLESDLIINLPKIKTHKYATITCSLKNMFGVIPDPLRIVYHQNIHQVVADLNKPFYQKIFTITDGVVCMEGQGPLYGVPRKLGIIMFSSNPLANDYVACRVMKIDPSEVKHLQLANEWAKLDFSETEILSYKPINKISNKPFAMANKNAFVKLEGFLMQNPFIVRLLFNDWFRKNITKKISFITDRMRGGSYKWYEQK
ncbi:MAG: DUF362 domain-containing protein [Patescibacteria group bacterium]|jgi:uncharacterized protein (DUF362 family)